MKRKLTKKVIDALPVDGSTSLIWDTEDDLPGFGIRFQGRTWRFIYKARTADQRQRWFALGLYGKVTVEQARRAAEDLRDQFQLERLGKADDPGLIRDRQTEIPTLQVFSKQYLEHVESQKKASTLKADRRNLAYSILPELGHLKVNRIGREHIAQYHHKRRHAPINANRCLSLLSHMMNVAESWGYRPQHANPCTHVKRYKETPRQRFLSQAELATLGETLTAVEKKSQGSGFGIAALKVLIFTGARAGEVLNLKHDDIDIEARTAKVTDSKTGPKTLYLNAPALEVLAKLHRIDGNDYVFPGAIPGRPFTVTGLEKVWYTVRTKAGLGDVTVHDLRHSYASIAVAGGASLPLLGRLLGHRRAETTLRYSHFEDDPLKAAASQIGGHIEAAMRGKRKARRRAAK